MRVREGGNRLKMPRKEEETVPKHDKVDASKRKVLKDKKGKELRVFMEGHLGGSVG